MNKKYLAKIIATDNEGLQVISACCANSKVKISDLTKFIAIDSEKINVISIIKKEMKR